MLQFRNKRQYTFSVSGPILKDQLFVGVSAKHYEKDGFINNTLLGGYTNDREHDYGRIHLRYTPADDLEISLISSKTEYDDGNIDYVIPYIAGDRNLSTDEQGYDKSSTQTHALKVSYDPESRIKRTLFGAYPQILQKQPISGD